MAPHDALTTSRYVSFGGAQVGGFPKVPSGPLVSRCCFSDRRSRRRGWDEAPFPQPLDLG